MNFVIRTTITIHESESFANTSRVIAGTTSRDGTNLAQSRAIGIHGATKTKAATRSTGKKMNTVEVKNGTTRRSTEPVAYSQARNGLLKNLSIRRGGDACYKRLP